MGVYTDWFIAKESEAKAFAKHENRFEKRPCLSMKSILRVEMMCLYGILLGKRKFDPSLGTTDNQLFYDGPEFDEEGNPLDEDNSGGVIVMRVVPDFILKLSELTPDNEVKIAEKWLIIESFTAWDDDGKAHVRDSLSKMIEFARRSLKLKKPILEVAVF